MMLKCPSGPVNDFIGSGVGGACATATAVEKSNERQRLETSLRMMVLAVSEFKAEGPDVYGGKALVESCRREVYGWKYTLASGRRD
jgi:hypothetical protein